MARILPAGSVEAALKLGGGRPIAWMMSATITPAPAAPAAPAPAPAGTAPTPAAALAPEQRATRRARFLQVIADSLAVHLTDNVDHLFHPLGVDLPPSGEAGARIAAQLDVLERADALWAGLGDEDSRDLLLRYLAYRALGPEHVRLQLDPGTYRRSVMSLNQYLRQAMVVPLPGLPMEWQLHLYDFAAAGMNIRVVGPALPLASTLAFSQYAYRDERVPARPKLGDVALDIGGCWGETALWLANAVGPDGFVHSFEPTPKNRSILTQNLDLNPDLRCRIAVWPQALCDRPGEAVLFPDVVAAGAAVQDNPGTDCPTVAVQTETVDRLVETGRVLPPSFVKIDVEGAELEVLHGAAETIRQHRPVLAIATYHRPEDLAVLPGYIASLGVGYRWYLQCSTMTDVDTVAFAVPDPS